MLIAAAASLGGCYATGDVGYRATYSSGGAYSNGGADVYVSTPDLVTVSPGVQVVADYDEPVFYTDGFYWRYYNNGWYRSNNYATGWNYYDRPPVAVLRIDRPHAYAHYRPRGYVSRTNRARYRPAAPIVRDHRTNVYRPEPVVREHRTVSPGVRAQPVTRGTRSEPVREHRDRDRNDRDDRRDDRSSARDRRR